MKIKKWIIISGSCLFIAILALSYDRDIQRIESQYDIRQIADEIGKDDTYDIVLTKLMKWNGFLNIKCYAYKNRREMIDFAVCVVAERSIEYDRLITVEKKGRDVSYLIDIYFEGQILKGVGWTPRMTKLGWLTYSWEPKWDHCSVSKKRNLERNKNDSESDKCAIPITISVSVNGDRGAGPVKSDNKGASLPNEQ